MMGDIWNTCMFVPELNKSECASWVQAWGTIAAVLVAVFLPPLIERRRQAREQRIAVFNARNLAGTLGAVIESMLEGLPFETSQDVMLRRVPLQAAANAATAGIALHYLSLDTAVAVLALQSISVQVVALMEDLERNPDFRAAAAARAKLEFYNKSLHQHQAKLLV